MDPWVLMLLTSTVQLVLRYAEKDRERETVLSSAKQEKTEFID